MPGTVGSTGTADEGETVQQAIRDERAGWHPTQSRASEANDGPVGKTTDLGS